MSSLAEETAVFSAVKRINLDNGVSIVVVNDLWLQILLDSVALIELMVPGILFFGRSGHGEVRVNEGVVTSDTLHALSIEDWFVLVGFEFSEGLDLLVEATIDSNASKLFLFITIFWHSFWPASCRFFVAKVGLNTLKSLLSLVLKFLFSTSSQLSIMAVLFAIREGGGVCRNTIGHVLGCCDVVFSVLRDFGEGIWQLGDLTWTWLRTWFVTVAKLGNLRLIFFPGAGLSINFLGKTALVEFLSWVLSSEVVKVAFGWVLVVDHLAEEHELCVILRAEGHMIFISIIKWIYNQCVAPRLARA